MSLFTKGVIHTISPRNPGSRVPSSYDGIAMSIYRCWLQGTRPEIGDYSGLDCGASLLEEAKGQLSKHELSRLICPGEGYDRKYWFQEGQIRLPKPRKLFGSVSLGSVFCNSHPVFEVVARDNRGIDALTGLIGLPFHPEDVQMAIIDKDFRLDLKRV